MLPHRPVDDPDSDRNLAVISALSLSFRIERIGPSLLPFVYAVYRLCYLC